MAKKKQEKIRGIFQPEIPLERLEKKQVAIPVSFSERRKVRYQCMRIKNGTWEGNDGIKEKIESQFERDMTWDGFTTVWDISQHDPYKVVRL